MKKRGIALPNIIMGVITILVVITAARVFTGLSSEPVKRLLGIGNLSAFDDSIVQRYNDTKNMNQDAIQSTTALLYGINRLVEYDKFNLATEGTEKSFGGVNVIPTDQNLRPLYLGAGGRDPGKQLAQAIVDCWTIFADEANENKYCFVIEPAPDMTGQVVESGLISGLEALKADEEACGSACQDKITDVLGDSWWPWDVANIDWDSDLVITKDSRNLEDSRKIIVCSDNTAINEVHITTKGSGNCQPKESEDILPKQIFIEDFSLPQTIAKSSNPLTYTVEDWLNAYGDPDYILFYEKFPEDEAQYWHANAYKVAWTAIVTAGALSITIDLATMGFGRILGRISRALADTVVGGAYRAVKSVIFDVVGGIGRKTVGGILKRIFKGSARAAVRKGLLKEAAEETVEKFVKENIGEVAERAAKSAPEIIDRFFREAGDDIISPITGRMTRAGRQKLANELAEGVSDKLAREITDSLVRVNVRKVPKALIKAFKTKSRLTNMLEKSLTGDISEVESKKALKALLEESSAGLNAMKPHELRTLARDINDIAGAFYTERGELILAREILEAAPDATSQKTARDAMKRRFSDFINLESELIERQTARSSSYLLGFARRVEAGVPTAIARQARLASLVTGSAAYYALKLESMAEKNYPVGTNAIGLKTPFMHTVVYDDEITEQLITKEGGDRNEFMEKFGSSEVYLGLLPEVEGYYLSLTRDRHAYWWDQEPIRFHLVSPCYADIMMRVTTCECYSVPDVEAGWYETGTAYPQLFEINPDRFPDGVQPDFDGVHKMLFRLDEEGRPLKQCVPSAGWFSFDNIYKPRCIEINPVLAEDNLGEYNYCYHGEDVGNQILSATITTLEIGLPFTCALAFGWTGVGPFLCMTGFGFATAMSGEYLREAIGVSQQWPNHG